MFQGTQLTVLVSNLEVSRETHLSRNMMEVFASKVESDLSVHQISLSVLFALWLILGLATYAFALFLIWLPQIESVTII